MNLEINTITNGITAVSRGTTTLIINFLNVLGISATPRFAGLISFIINLSLIFFSLKIVKPLLKWTIIILLGLLLLSFFVPTWWKMAKLKIRCNERKGGCGETYEVDEKNVKFEKFIQCPYPYCRRIAPNPLYIGETQQDF